MSIIREHIIAIRTAADDLVRARASAAWDQAVSFLRDYVPENVKQQILTMREMNDPTWPAAYHMDWGMGIRNALRQRGFGEVEMGVANLDNIYVELVEAAVVKQQHEEA